MADFDIGGFTKKLVMGVVLILVYVALLVPLNSALDKWAANDTTFGPIGKAVIPLLIGVGILLGYIYAFIPQSHKYMGFHD